MSAPGRGVPAQVRLSPRELQVLVRMSYGGTNRAIGEELYLAEDSVKTLLRRMFRKLGVSDRAGAVRAGFELGVLTTGSARPGTVPVVAVDWQAVERARECEIGSEARPISVRHIGACYAAMSCPCRARSTWRFDPVIGVPAGEEPVGEASP